MELKSFALKTDAVRVEIKHPLTAAETDIAVFVLSPDSPDVKDRVLESMRKGVAPHDRSISAALIAQREEMVARLITGWENITLNAKPFKYSPANAVKLCREFPWIMEQVDQFCKNRENFFKGSDKA